MTSSTCSFGLVQRQHERDGIAFVTRGGDEGALGIEGPCGRTDIDPDNRIDVEKSGYSRQAAAAHRLEGARGAERLPRHRFDRGDGRRGPDRGGDSECFAEVEDRMAAG